MNSDKLSNIIDELVKEKTFNLEGVAAVNQLREKALKLESDFEYTKKELTSVRDSLTKTSEKLSQKDIELSEWKSREASLKKREDEITNLEKQAAVADAKSFVYDSVFTRIFANRVVRENTFQNRNEVHPTGSGYPATFPVTDTTTRELTHE